jgi:alkanesulfonate monooxygenase SsuD/methylene tetrahydromethanopterin reductase-like flavin-dependent oxidoreductase (luciferase family)
MVGVNIIAAETDVEARRLFTSAQMAFTNLIRGTRGRLRPPIDDIESYWTLMEKAQVSQRFSCSFVGAPDSLRPTLERFIAETQADELIVAAAIHDHEARKKSYGLLAEIRPEWSGPSRGVGDGQLPSLGRSGN